MRSYRECAYNSFSRPFVLNFKFDDLTQHVKFAQSYCFREKTAPTASQSQLFVLFYNLTSAIYYYRDVFRHLSSSSSQVLWVESSKKKKLLGNMEYLATARENKFSSIKSLGIDGRRRFFNLINPHTPDRFTPSHARCAENYRSTLTHRQVSKKESLKGLNWYFPKDAHQKSEGGQLGLI